MGYAIVTRYHGPTNYRGSRVIGTGPALTHDGPKVRVTVDWDYGAGNPGAAYSGWGDSDANHRRAADAVVAKLRGDGWDVSLDADDRGATLPDERGMVYVLRYGRSGLRDSRRDESPVVIADDLAKRHGPCPTCGDQSGDCPHYS